jgi:hypothetical protein
MSGRHLNACPSEFRFVSIFTKIPKNNSFSFQSFMNGFRSGVMFRNQPAWCTRKGNTFVCDRKSIKIHTMVARTMRFHVKVPERGRMTPGTRSGIGINLMKYSYISFMIMKVDQSSGPKYSVDLLVDQSLRDRKLRVYDVISGGHSVSKYSGSPPRGQKVLATLPFGDAMLANSIQHQIGDRSAAQPAHGDVKNVR